MKKSAMGEPTNNESFNHSSNSLIVEPSFITNRLRARHEAVMIIRIGLLSRQMLSVGLVFAENDAMCHFSDTSTLAVVKQAREVGTTNSRALVAQLNDCRQQLKILREQLEAQISSNTCQATEFSEVGCNERAQLKTRLAEIELILLSRLDSLLRPRQCS
jgi:DNA anti-recombination protein RmuC